MSSLLKWLSRFLLILPLLAAGAVFILLFSPFVLPPLLRAAQEILASDGLRLEIEKPRGALGRGFSVSRFSVRGKTWQVEGEGLRFSWSLLGLWRSHLLAAQGKRIRIVILPSEEGGDKDLGDLGAGVPLGVKIRIGSFELDQGDGSPLRLDDLNLLWRFGGNRHRIEYLDAHFLGRRLHAREVSLFSLPPHAFSGDFSISGISPYPFAALARASGTLEAMALQISARSQETNLWGQGKVYPFSNALLEGIFHFEGADPRLWDAALPRGLFSGEIKMEAKDSLWRIETRLDNSAPGSLKEDKIPVLALFAKAAGPISSLMLEDMQVQTLGGGKVMAKGSLFPLKGSVRLENLSPASINPGLPNFPVQGEILFEEKKGIGVLANLFFQEKRLSLDALWQDGEVFLKQARLKEKASLLEAQGRVNLAESHFLASLRLQDFDPSLFGPYPSAKLTGQALAKGNWAPEVSLFFESKGISGSLEKKPFMLAGQARLKNNVPADAKLVLSWGSAKATADGGIQQGKGLRLHLESRRLADLPLSLAGEGEMQVLFFGAPDALSGEGRISMSSLSAKDFAAKRVLGDFSFEKLGRKNLEAKVLAEGAAAQGKPLGDIHLLLHGDLSSHALSLESKDISFRLAGGYEKSRWQGGVERLSWKDFLALQGLAPLSWDKGIFSLGPASLRLGRGKAVLSSLRWQKGSFLARGDVFLLNLDDLPLQWKEGMRTNLSLAGNFSLEGKGPEITGNALLRRLSGDIYQEPMGVLGIENIEATFSSSARETRASLRASGKKLGNLLADASAPGIFSLSAAEKKPLTGQILLDVPDLSWLSPFVALDAQVQGGLRLQGRVEGPPSSLDFFGDLDSRDLSLSVPSQGISWKKIRIQASARGKEILFQELLLQDAKKGEMRARGRVNLAPRREGKVDIALKRFLLSDLDDRLVCASGKANFLLFPEKAQFLGDFILDEGRFTLDLSPGGGRRSQDVVVKGRPVLEKPSPRPLPVAVRASLGLGKDVWVKGEGAQARLEGRVLLESQGGDIPTATGRIEVKEGDYRAWGQRLDLSEGAFTFAGPLDNPALYLKAIRPRIPVTVGVLVEGTARHPEVGIFSDPPLPDQEALSWLVLGHDLAGAGSGDLMLLAGAAQNLLGGDKAARISARVAKGLGLEEFAVGEGEAVDGTAVRAGRHLSEDIRVTYEQSLQGGESITRLIYDITSSMNVQLQGGTRSIIEFFYNFSFD